MGSRAPAPGTEADDDGGRPGSDRRDGLLDAAARRADLGAALELLGEVSAQAPADPRTRVTAVRTHLAAALPGLLAFAGARDPVHRDLTVVLGEAGVALVGWTWRHRHVLGPDIDALVGGFPPRWHSAARVLSTAWTSATRASSPAETWHRVRRPHVAAHRTRSPGLLSLLAVSHHYRLRPRGVNHGMTPLPVCGVPDAPVGWQAALGYTSAPPTIHAFGTEEAIAA